MIKFLELSNEHACDLLILYIHLHSESEHVKELYDFAIAFQEIDVFAVCTLDFTGHKMYEARFVLYKLLSSVFPSFVGTFLFSISLCTRDAYS